MRRRAAFTLIELLVVMAIIGLLAGMMFPIFGAMRTRAKITKARHEAGQIDTAWKAYQLKERSLLSVSEMKDASDWAYLEPYMETTNLMKFANGIPVDPWNEFYQVHLENILDETDPGKDRAVKVWSKGPDKKSEGYTSTNGGDDARSW